MNNTGNLKLIITLAVVSLLAAACGSAASGPNSPGAVTKRFVEAARQKDVKAFKSLLARKSIATLEKDAREVGIPLDEMLAKTLEQDLVPAGPNALETRNEKISGDTATVEFKQGNGRWSQNELVREDGNCKVTLE